MLMPETCFGSATIKQGSCLLIENPKLWAWLQIYGNPEAEPTSSRISLDDPGLIAPQHAVGDVRNQGGMLRDEANEPALSFAKA
jgi:hypothetical protein